MLDVAGVRGGDPGPPGPVGNRVCSRVLGNPPPEPGGGEPPGALSQKGAEGAGSRGTRMLLGPWRDRFAVLGLGSCRGWPRSGSTVAECPLRPPLAQGGPGYKEG